MKFTSDYTRVAAQFMAPDKAMEELGINGTTGTLEGDRQLLMGKLKEHHPDVAKGKYEEKKMLAANSLWEMYIREKKTLPVDVGEASQGEDEWDNLWEEEQWAREPRREEQPRDSVRDELMDEPTLWHMFYIVNNYAELLEAYENTLEVDIRKFIHVLEMAVERTQRELNALPRTDVEGREEYQKAVDLLKGCFGPANRLLEFFQYDYGKESYLDVLDRIQQSIFRIRMLPTIKKTKGGHYRASYRHPSYQR